MERILELTSPESRFLTYLGQREFIGYLGDTLPNGRRFFHLNAVGETKEMAAERLTASLRLILAGVKGHLHWKQGIQIVSFVQTDNGSSAWLASCAIAVDPYLPNTEGPLA